MALTLGIIAGGGIVAAAIVNTKIIRKELKKGDVLIHEEAARERAAAYLKPAGKLHHVLHPHHDLVLVYGTTSFRCDACQQHGEGFRYRCNTCDFDLHESCAKSIDIMLGLIATETVHKPLVHEHPLTLTSSNSSSKKCNYCKSNIDKKYRYYCKQCKKHFHLMCVAHPARLTSFLHPQHDLELKIKHRLSDCSVCHHGGEMHARVYSCESCKFYVHSDCAAKIQCINHPLHNDKHTLVYGAVLKGKSSVRCTVCKHKCKHWSFSCSVCKDVHFHHDCLFQSTTEKSNEKADIGEIIETGLDIADLAMNVIDVVSFLTS